MLDTRPTRTDERAPQSTRTTSSANAMFVGLAFVVSLLVFGAWALSSPIGSSPDDDFHLASTWCGQDEPGDLCAGEGAERAVPRSLLESPTCYFKNSATSARCQDELSWSADELVSSTRLNSTGLYPGGYYWAMNPAATDDLQASALRIRLANSALALVALALALIGSTPDLRRSLARAWMVSVVPLGLFLIASNNPSAWALIGIGTLWVPLLGLFSEKRMSRQSGILVVSAVFSGALAVGARTDSAMYVLLSLAAAAIAAKAWRHLPTPATFITALALVVMAAISVLAASQDHVITTGFGEESTNISGASLFIYNVFHLHELVLGFVGGGRGLGWLDTPLPLAVLLLAVSAIAVVVGLSRPKMRSVGGLGSLAFVGAIVSLPLLILQLGGNYVGQSLQPRYLLPLLIPAAGMALSVAQRSVSLTGRLYVVGALTVAHSIALHTNIRRYVVGLDVDSLNLNSTVEWWWSWGPSPMAVWAVGTAAFGVLAVLVFVVFDPTGSPSESTNVS